MDQIADGGLIAEALRREPAGGEIQSAARQRSRLEHLRDRRPLPFPFNSVTHNREFSNVQTTEHGDRIGLRLTPEAKRLLGTAAAALGVSKSHFVRAIVVQALRHEPIARAALEELDRPEYPQFVSGAV
jgi:uncharacterized protein (DUF1778 family)